ncbi:MAG TPA: alpha/beta hydrolase [Alphaproteobacteria bacterium]|nr:alpha/beta hydrolase [Alphaproteobacteria bacterium]
MPQVQGLGTPQAPARLAADRFVAADGKALPLQVWPAQGAPRAVIVALHGFNMYRRYFDAPAPWWAARGITTYAYDQRGFGAGPDSGIWPGTPALVADARAVVRLARRRHPGVPIYLLGDSMGAAVAMLAASGEGAPQLDGLILVAPAVWGGEAMSPLTRISLWLAAHLMPWNVATGGSLRRMPTDNIEFLRALGRDPLVIKRTRIDAIYGVTRLMGAAFAVAPRVPGPLLVLYGERDEIVPSDPVYEAVAAMTATRRFAVYPNGWHMLLHDLQAETVWQDVVAWIADPDAPLPSGAAAAEGKGPGREAAIAAGPAPATTAGRPAPAGRQPHG